MRLALVDQLRHPIVQAPMAGGASTVDLAAAVGDAGGLGFIAAGYRGAGEVEADIAELRARTRAAFGVNVFVPPRRPADFASYAGHVERLRPLADEYGIRLGNPRFDDDGWDAKLDVLDRAVPPVVSFVFGCPDAAVVDRLQRAGSEVWITVTDPDEARAAVAAGADALVAQGHEAGAHRATFEDAAADDPIGLLSLLQLLGELGRPLVAAGGIATGAGIAAALCAGAAAAQIGTALLRCPEAGTAPVHRAALTAPTRTRLTRAFTGRQARAIVNEFVERFDDAAPSAYPEVHYATAPLRRAARDAADARHLHLWAGQTHRLARELPAGELITRLAAEADKALAGAQRRLQPARSDAAQRGSAP